MKILDPMCSIINGKESGYLYEKNLCGGFYKGKKEKQKKMNAANTKWKYIHLTHPYRPLRNSKL